MSFSIVVATVIVWHIDLDVAPMAQPGHGPTPPRIEPPPDLLVGKDVLNDAATGEEDEGNDDKEQDGRGMIRGR
jgi:hypothetical protein